MSGSDTCTPAVAWSLAVGILAGVLLLAVGCARIPVTWTPNDVDLSQYDVDELSTTHRDFSRVGLLRDITVISFSGEDDLYIMNADGTNQTRIAANVANRSQAAVSPDGQTISFRTNRDGTKDIYLIEVDGTNERPLVTGGSDAEESSWGQVTWPE